ncbi:MAG: DUF3306 domain-containing protein [Burkholderiaceae bacterium]
MMVDDADGFLSRWSRRKSQVSGGAPVAPEPVAAEASPVAAEASTAVAQSPELRTGVGDVAPEPPAAPLPTMADVAMLTRQSDYSRFVAPGIDEGVKRAAMKKLFSDPHFNVMDGLDIYIDDYGKPDPIPLAMLRQLNQSKYLGLFDHEEDDAEKSKAEAPNPAPALTAAHGTEPTTPSDDDSDLQLQQDDAAGRPGPDQGPGA